MGSRKRPIIVHIVHSLQGGGTERSLVNMLSLWRHDVFDHRVVTLRAAGSLAASLPYQVACYPMGTNGRSRTAWLRLAGILRKWRPNLIHARNTSCWTDATLANLLVPNSQLILGFHGLESATPLPRIVASLAKFALHTGAVFATVSKAGQHILSQEAAIPQSKTTVLRNGVDSKQYPPPTLQQKQRARRKLAFENGEFVVGSVGSLTPVKNHQHLLAAFSNIIIAGYRAKLLIVGDGPLRKKLSELVSQLRLNQHVRFVGESDNVISCLHAMDVFVCSSDSESLSNSLLEAMSAGLPVISTDVGDHGWALSNGNGAGNGGIIVPTGDTEALTKAIVRMVTNATYRIKLGQQARVKAIAFDINTTIKAYEQYYTSLTQAHLATTPTLSTTPKHMEKRLIEPTSLGPVIYQSTLKSNNPQTL